MATTRKFFLLSRRRILEILLMIVVLVSILLFSYSDTEVTHMDRILERGEIVLVTRNGPTSYYIEKEEESGMEFKLAKLFASELGIGLKVIVARNFDDMKEILATGSADFAAASLINTGDNGHSLMFGPGYQWVTQQLVYRNGSRRPDSLSDISPAKLELAADTVNILPLDSMKENNPGLEWEEHAERDSHEMLELIENSDIVYTIADSNQLTLVRHIYPEIRIAFNVTSPQPVAWAFQQSEDLSLLNAVWRFHEKISGSGQLSALIREFYGPVEKFDYVDSRKFVDRIDRRFSKYESIFKETAARYDLDWRMLAAVSYQESHWNERAVSPTGVRGLMMLTRDTAQSVGVDDRLDPLQSIDGGAQYLVRMINKIPERIPEPDRTWMALAAYNVGFGHLEDARIITEKQGADPDSWAEVKKHLPLLSRKQWYKQTRFGYARGLEPVLYVERVRKYYNTLVQLTQPNIPHYELYDYQMVENADFDIPVF